MAFTGITNEMEERRYKSKTEERLATNSFRKNHMSSTERRLKGMTDKYGTTDRGVVDRVLGTIGNTSIVEGLYNLTDDDENTTFRQGLVQGLHYQNPFTDDVSNRHSFSDVLKNIGWEDNDPNKISGSDVGRGVVGLAGDILLDPLSYINPFGAVSQVVKGSGVTKEGIKALQKASIIDDVSDLTKGRIATSKVDKLHNLSLDEAKNIVRSTMKNADLTEEQLTEEAVKFLERYASRVEKVRNADEGSGLYIGLNFSSKKKAGDKTAKTLNKELISSEKLRRLGDNTIAPAYNSLAKSIRTSNLGRKFSKLNEIEGLSSIKGADEGFKKFYTDELLKALDKIPADLKDIKNAEYIEEWWKELSEDQKYKWLDAYENGDLSDANAFLKFKAKLKDGAGKINTDDLFTTDVDKIAFTKQTEEFIKTINKFVGDKVGKLDYMDRKYIRSALGKNIDEMDDFELVTALRFADKINYKGGSYREMMKHYYISTSKYKHVRDRLVEYATETDALKAFKRLPLQDRQILINNYYTNPAGDVLDVVGKERKVLDDDIFKVFEGDPNQREFYARMSNVLDDGFIPDFGYISSQLKSIRSGISKANKFDDKSLEIAKLIGDRMDELAQKEVSRGLLKQSQADALRGKYLQHITTEDMKVMNDFLHENQNGQFNPDILGLMKKFDYSRTGGTIAEINVEGKILEDALHEIYLARTLGSNKLVYGIDTQNFIKHNFGKSLKSVDLPEKGYEAAIPYKDLNIAIKNKVKTRFNEMVESYTKAGNKEAVAEFKSLKSEIMDDMREDIIHKLYPTEKERIMFSPNITMQTLNDSQRKIVESLGLEPFQIQKNILDRTNVLSRTQKAEQTSAMLNLFDRMQNIWKLQNTLVTPGFHVQNSISNMFQSFLGVGADAINPKKLRKAYNILNLKDPKQTITLGGVKYTYKEIEHIARKTGVLDELFHKYEFNYGSDGGTLRKIGIPKSLDPTDIDEFFLYKAGTKAGTTIEATQRMNLFMSALDQGKSIEDAVDTVNKFLFDYSDLTEFEQQTLKRIVPFYTFMKKNIPMELEQMLMQPRTFTTINRTFENFGKMNEDTYLSENDRTEWRQEDVQIPFNIGGKPFGIADNLPYTQFDRVFDARKLLGQTTPALKVPVELAMGETIFTEMPIDNYGQYFANQIAYPKMWNMKNKKDEGSTRNLYALGQALGFPINEMKRPYYDWSKLEKEGN